MSDDYQRVEEALAAGAAPAMLCATCPWDRYCVTPPTMSKDDVEKAMAEAGAQDEAQHAAAKAAGRAPGMPVSSLVTALAVAGRHQQARACPVFVLRLRSSRGRALVDGVKTSMQGWDDES
jgi:hypothetical protein